MTEALAGLGRHPRTGRTAGFAEYFDCNDGSPAGGGAFSWTAATWLQYAAQPGALGARATMSIRGPMGAIELKAVEKWFDDLQVIKGVDLKIEDGEFVVLSAPQAAENRPFCASSPGWKKPRAATF
jgi:hypothetical protein